MVKGGVTESKDVMGYKSPYGPTSIEDTKSPGIHGNVYPSGTQSASTQGGESGSPGLGGKNRKAGSQR